eukprot:2034742-Prymnesium_polylepis.3
MCYKVAHETRAFCMAVTQRSSTSAWSERARRRARRRGGVPCTDAAYRALGPIPRGRRILPPRHHISDRYE